MSRSDRRGLEFLQHSFSEPRFFFLQVGQILVVLLFSELNLQLHFRHKQDPSMNLALSAVISEIHNNVFQKS